MPVSAIPEVPRRAARDSPSGCEEIATLRYPGTGKSFACSEHTRNIERPIMAEQLHNPKLDEHPDSNTEKDPADWVSGGDPMTGAQASYLTTLCEEAKVEAPSADLSKADASKMIDELKEKLGH